MNIGTFRKFWEMIGSSLLWSKSAMAVKHVGGGGIYCGLPPSGTVAANGTYNAPAGLLTLVTTSVPGTWCYLPAGALASGVPGMYWFGWTSTLSAQVYAPNVAINTATGFDPYVPDISEMALVVGSGTAFTQTTVTNIVVASHKIPGGFLGKYGSIMAEYNAASSSSATAKTPSVRVNNITAASHALTTTVYASSKLVFIRNMGVENRQQVYGNNLPGAVSNTAPVGMVHNTANDVFVQFCVQTTATNEWVFIMGNVLAIPKG